MITDVRWKKCTQDVEKRYQGLGHSRRSFNNIIISPHHLHQVQTKPSMVDLDKSHFKLWTFIQHSLQQYKVLEGGMYA